MYIEYDRIFAEQKNIIKKLQKRVNTIIKQLQEQNRNEIQHKNNIEENISNIERELNVANNNEKKKLNKNLTQISKLNDAFK